MTNDFKNKFQIGTYWLNSKKNIVLVKSYNAHDGNEEDNFAFLGNDTSYDENGNSLGLITSKLIKQIYLKEIEHAPNIPLEFKLGTYWLCTDNQVVRINDYQPSDDIAFWADEHPYNKDGKALSVFTGDIVRQVLILDEPQ